MHSLWFAAVLYAKYSTRGIFELPTQSGTLLKKTIRVTGTSNVPTSSLISRYTCPQWSREFCVNHGELLY